MLLLLGATAGQAALHCINVLFQSCAVCAMRTQLMCATWQRDVLPPSTRRIIGVQF